MARGTPRRGGGAFLAAELKKHGFVQGVASPCCFFHAARWLRCVVHGDDFVLAGPESALKRVEARMHESFLVKVAVVVTEQQCTEHILRFAHSTHSQSARQAHAGRGESE